MNVAKQTRSRPMLDSPLLRRGDHRFLPKLSPRVQIRNPVMFVVWIGAILTSLLAVQAALGRGEASFGFVLAIALWLWITVLFANFAEAVAEGPRQGPGAGAAQRAADGRRQAAPGGRARRADRPRPGHGARQGGLRAGRGRRRDPLRRRGDRGRRHGGRERHHRRERARHARERRRPQRRDRRHARALGLDRGARHGQPRRRLPRPHDRARRGGQARAHAQRDRAGDPARRADDRVPAGDGHAASPSRPSPWPRAARARSSRSRCWSRCSCA